jgi:serine/threonine protein kinase
MAACLLTVAQILCRKEISYQKMSQKDKELRHPNIVAYFERDHIKASQDLHLYMEYCGNGDLGRIIKDLKSKGQVCEEEFVWSIFSQIVSALYRCHYGEDPPAAGRNVMGLGATAKPARDPRKPMILHRDLKPENSTYLIFLSVFYTYTCSLPRRGQLCQAGRLRPLQDPPVA